MKMPRTYTFDVPDFDDCGGRTTRRVEVPKAVFRQIETDVAAPLEVTIHQLGENAAKAAGEYAEEVGRLRNHADMLAQLLTKACGDISALLIFGSREGDIRPWTAEYTQAINVHDAHFAPRAALTEPTDG